MISFPSIFFPLGKVDVTQLERTRYNQQPCTGNDFFFIYMHVCVSKVCAYRAAILLPKKHRERETQYRDDNTLFVRFHSIYSGHGGRVVRSVSSYWGITSSESPAEKLLTFVSTRRRGATLNFFLMMLRFNGKRACWTMNVTSFDS